MYHFPPFCGGHDGCSASKFSGHLIACFLFMHDQLSLRRYFLCLVSHQFCLSYVARLYCMVNDSCNVLQNVGSNAQAEISCLTWNPKFQHILASASSNGITGKTVWLLL